MSTPRVVIALTILLLAPVAVASKTTQTAVDPDLDTYRHTQMESMGKHMKMLSLIAKGRVDRPQDALGHAQALHAAGESMSGLFPAGQANPKIEADREGFEAASRGYLDATAALVTAAESGELPAIQSALSQVAPTCGACHDGFRVD